MFSSRLCETFASLREILSASLKNFIVHVNR